MGSSVTPRNLVTISLVLPIQMPIQNPPKCILQAAKGGLFTTKNE